MTINLTATKINYSQVLKEATPSGKFICRDSGEELSPLRILRETRNLTQKDLADRLQIERTRIIRMEKKPWEQLSLGDIEIYARGLGITMQGLYDFLDGLRQTPRIQKFNIEKMEYVMSAGKNWKYTSVLENPGVHFIGTLILSANQTLSKEDVHRAPFLFYLVLEGEMVVTLTHRDYWIRENEGFVVENADAYELYNPNSLKRVKALVFSGPQ